MRNFAIRDIENLSGIKAHTLRMWEQRFDFIKPRRCASNFRHYTIDEVKYLLNISLLTRNGYRISRVSAMKREEISLVLDRLTHEEDQQQKAVNDLVVYMYTFDFNSFESTIHFCFKQWDASVVMKKILREFLQKTGLMWQGNKQTEEHFAVTCIRKKMTAAIDQLTINTSANNTVLLFLPDSKQLDLILLYTHYLLSLNGFRVIYMGRDVSDSNLLTICRLKQPDAALTYLPLKNEKKFKQLSLTIKSQSPKTKMIMVPFPEPVMSSISENVYIMALDGAIDLLNSSFNK